MAKHTRATARGLLARFSSRANAGELRDLLARQVLTRCEPGAIDEMLAQIGPGVGLAAFETGAILTHQDAADRHLFLILLGSVEILVNGTRVAVRSAGEHVGEMACVDPGAKRSAAIRAREPTVVLRVASDVFGALLEKYPRIWRPIALTLSERLTQRGRREREANLVPVVFIGSSTERLAVARVLEKHLAESTGVETVLWEDVFKPSKYGLESLSKAASRADFAVLLFSGDDFTRSRGHRQPSPRDNIVFEAGLFAGKLGHERTFVVCETNAKVKLPSDLLGLTWIGIELGNEKRARASVQPACVKIAAAIAEAGAR